MSDVDIIRINGREHNITYLEGNYLESIKMGVLHILNMYDSYDSSENITEKDILIFKNIYYDLKSLEPNQELFEEVLEWLLKFFIKNKEIK